jgi:hypothetical protein
MGDIGNSLRHLGMIEIPTRFVPRFFVLPGREEDRHSIMILDDLVRLRNRS